MSVTDCLRKARELLSDGWAAPPFPQMLDGCDKGGSSVPYSDEGIYRFTPRGALRSVALTNDELLAAWETLESISCPHASAEVAYAFHSSPDPEVSRQLALASAGKSMTFDDWAARGRTLKDILHAFDLAVLRSTRGDA